MSGLDGPRLTYGGADGQPMRIRKGPPLLTVLLLVAAVVLAVVVVRLTLSTSDRVERAGPAATPAGATASGGVTPSTQTPAAGRTPAPSSVPVGDDAATSTNVPVGASETATKFVAAWFDRDPETRKPALQQVATTRLVDQLAGTDPAKIPTTPPQSTPQPVNVSEYAAEFVQPIGDGTSLRLTLVADPAADAGWLVDSATPVD